VQSGGRTETNANKEEKTIPVEVAAIDADNDPVRGREAAIELEFPLDVLILAVGHQWLPRHAGEAPVRSTKGSTGVAPRLASRRSNNPGRPGRLAKMQQEGVRQGKNVGERPHRAAAAALLAALLPPLAPAAALLPAPPPAAPRPPPDPAQGSRHHRRPAVNGHRVEGKGE
jgi:hypothetical protein